MKLRRKALWSATAAAVLGAAAWVLLRPTTNPVYQGQRMSVWFSQLVHPRNPGDSTRAKQAIQSSGAPAIPFLVGQLHAKDSPLSRKYERFYIGHLQRWPLWLRSRFPIPRENDAESRRAQAVMARGSHGPAAQPAISDLVSSLSPGGPFLASSAAHVLSGLAPPTR